MKNLLAIIIAVVFCASISFAGVNDNTTSNTNRTGTSNFGASIITPVYVTAGTAVTLDDYVVAPLAPYTTFSTNHIDFTVTGQANHAFYFINSATNKDNTIATFGGGWSKDGTHETNGTATLSASGAYTLTYTLTSITALKAGSAELDLSVSVSYNADL